MTEGRGQMLLSGTPRTLPRFDHGDMRSEERVYLGRDTREELYKVSPDVSEAIRLLAGWWKAVNQRQ